MKILKIKTGLEDLLHFPKVFSFYNYFCKAKFSKFFMIFKFCSFKYQIHWHLYCNHVHLMFLWIIGIPCTHHLKIFCDLDKIHLYKQGSHLLEYNQFQVHFCQLGHNILYNVFSSLNFQLIDMLPYISPCFSLIFFNCHCNRYLWKFFKNTRCSFFYLYFLIFDCEQ